MRERVLVMPEGVLFSGFAFREKRRVVFGTDALLQFAPPGVERPAAVRRFRRFAAELTHRGRHFLGEVRTLPLDSQEAVIIFLSNPFCCRILEVMEVQRG